jgi:hypothetical protein
MIFATMAFKHFYHDDAAWESKFYCEPCLVVSMPEIFELSSSNSRKSSPMGVNCRIFHPLLIIDDEFDSVLYYEADIYIFIGCATSAPDGSSPRGYN